MNRSHRRLDPAENAGEEPDALSEEVLERGRKVRHAIEAGLRFHRQGDLRQAADVYYYILEIHVDQADALHLLGLISYQSSETESALRLVARAITSDPDNAVFYISQGDILQTLGRLTGAVESYRHGLALDPELPEAFNNCGNALHAQHKLGEATGYYQHAIAIRPDYSAAHNNLGNALRDQGRIEDSILSFETALRYTPDFATVHNNLGNALRDAGRCADAITSHRRALALEPDFAEAHFNLGNALSEAAILDQAAASYREAVTLRPDFADAHYNLANTLRDSGRADEAIEAYRLAIGIKASHLDAHNNVANVLKDLGRYEEAKCHFHIVLRLDADNANAAHLLAALEGRTTEIAPRRYVREMFDRYAAIFEKQLVGELDYQVPGHLRTAVGRCHAPGFGHALDLGCGTGLVAAAFEDVVETWHGVDLSPAMIAQATSKGVYDGLHVDDVVDFLDRATTAGETAGFELITAGDVFIYIGNLAPTFAAVRARITGAGVFAFTVEVTEGAGADYVLCPTGRYAHGEGYVRALAAEHGFEVAACDAVTLRREHDRPVAGLVFVLRHKG